MLLCTNPSPYRSPYPSPSPNPNVLEGEGRAVVHEREHVEPGDLRRRQHRRALLVRVGVRVSAHTPEGES